MDPKFPEENHIDFENLPNTQVFKTVFPKGSYIGPYQVIEEVGQGGMARVYKAYHQRLERFVAIKVMDRQVVSKENHQRFAAEAKLTARLQHPNIVAVHDVGAALGLNYIVMDYIEGTSLRDIIFKNEMSIGRACDIVKQIARGLHYAHSKGVIHRDIKPSNIIITKQGHPVIMDFGLAKNTNMTEDITKSGVIIGTPKYMAPEQIKGENHDISRSTDVYGLGAVFYEILTKKPVVQGETPLSISYSILNKAVVPPRTYRNDIPQDVQTICLKALEKNKKDRYISTKALADDIDRFLSGEAITARQENKLYLLQKKAGRYKLWFLVSLCVIFFALNILQLLFFTFKEDDSISKLEYTQLLEKYNNLKNEYEDVLSQQQNTQNIEMLFQVINNMFFVNDANKAIELIDELMENSEQNKAMLYCYRAYSYINLKKYRNALDDLNQAISIDDDLTTAYLMRGRIFTYFKMNDNAIKDFEFLLTKQKKADFILVLCNVYIEEKRYSDAEEKLQELIQENPANYNAYYGLAKSYLNQKKYNQAITYSIETLKKNNQHASAYYILGYSYYFLQNWQKSVQFFNRAEQLDPGLRFNETLPPFYYFRGISQKNLGSLKKAFQDFSKGIRFFSKPAQQNNIYYLCLLERARIYGKNRKHELAVSDYRKVRENLSHLLTEEDIRYLETYEK